ncbi:MAG: 23S rRNA (adenine(2503)-C(2))-methyltransferase RlmN [Acidaminococcus sp.]|jgi:23S rRNA (adenine2503-C2)-methyltransferase|nr:23S rRNA (adenine(2503)-C(2))-methyltransferase RlmN [Acidaminococcus sp.]MCI2100473.1 23S rRNA (adenine(2503)-C(2))-methyltransferase RlmN [Acidaminococcus sp.]MCI2114794.1 23S rRNA (adenine(2503)-C(2))-methyltransferase RlmN [Acidaminococcus sp.]MCI2116847.1 23S rRNA (adenine(2503)-C(2))-methyltransferase RlmN [Acidaminococcus sp.]
MTKKEIMGLTLPELQEELMALGFKKFRAEQVFRWLYEKSAVTFDEMSNLSKKDRALLAEKYSIAAGEVRILKEYRSTDGLTHKVLLELSDGASVETVLMHHDYGYSACLSSQVGCAMNCAFCASGLHGFVRNLKPAEILAQLYYFQHILQQKGERVSRVVIMGSGEPMLNLDNVLKALDILHSDRGQCIGYRNMTISTCGVVPGIRELTRQGRTINLAVSLHAATEVLRNRLMPINHKYPFPETIAAADEYEHSNGRQVMYEYILLAGVNDSEDDAKALADVLTGRECVVNLIPANPVPEKGFARPSDKQVDRFFQYLKKRHINVTVRREMGKDINAACGQLRASMLKEAKA